MTSAGKTSSVTYKINICIAVALAILNSFQLLFLPLFALPLNPFLGLLIIPAAAFNNTLWYLIHESFHLNLLRHTGSNRLLGSLMCLFHGGSWTLLRFCHLMHHRFNRSALDRPDTYDSSSRRIGQVLLYYFRLLGGLYLGELILPLFFFLKEKTLREVAQRYLREHDRESGRALLDEALKAPLNPEGIRSVRIEYACSIGLFGLSLFLYGKYWPFFLLFLSLRALTISITDNLPHYGTSLRATRYAKNLSAPSWLRLLVMNFNFHGIHHLRPGTPWAELPVEFRKQGLEFDDSYIYSALRQLSGPLPAKDLADPTP